jgi:peptidoglycan/LPS O-acetylase OafA/YrhL
LLDYYSTWPFFVEIGLILALASTPLFRAADAPPIPEGRRIQSLDGLRGFLALLVFYHHIAVYHQYLQTHRWDNPQGRFYLLAGSVGVSLFFMITGTLFYSQVLQAKGRLNWKKLYVGRVFRILPLYWFAVAWVLIMVGMRTGWHRHVSYRNLALQLFQWSAGGLLGEHWVNGYSDISRITLFVTWTLQYEWIFYLSLPLLAILVRSRRIGLLLPPFFLLGALCFLWIFVPSNRVWICVALFLVGMSTAALKSARPQLRLQSIWASLTVIALLTLTFVLCPNVYMPLSAVLLGGAFVLINSGANLFGLLASAPAKRLGNISYGIYLLQGPLLTVFVSFKWIRALDFASPLGHAGASLIEACALVALATIAHRWIERPGIDFGRRLLSKRGVSPIPVSSAEHCNP